jgi:hypothetical protein
LIIYLEDMAQIKALLPKDGPNVCGIIEETLDVRASLCGAGAGSHHRIPYDEGPKYDVPGCAHSTGETDFWD